MKTENFLDLRYSIDPVRIFTRYQAFHSWEKSKIKQHIDEHGWVLVRNVLQLEEIKDLYENIERSEIENIKGDLLSNEYLNLKTVLNSKILSVVNEILPSKPVYFGDSVASSVFTKGVIGFHKDNPDKEDPSKPDWQTPYTIVRVGIYLQNYSKNSGGLGFRDYSHKTVDVTKGRPVFAESQPGDVLVWYHTTTHSGYMSRPRLLPNLYLPLPLLSKLCVKDDEYAPPKWLFRPHPAGKRAALFFSFGVRDNHLERYLKYLLMRQYAVGNWRHSFYGDEVKKQCENIGLDLIDMRNIADAVDWSTLKKDHDSKWDESIALNRIGAVHVEQEVNF